MKIFLQQRYENEAFESVLVRPTTKFEKMALKLFKEDLFDDDGFFNPSLLGEELCVRCARALGYNIPEHYNFDANNGVLYWWEEGEFPGYQHFNCIPSNTEVLEAAYKMAGRYRKLARLRKEIKRIEKVCHTRYERVYNDLSKKIDEAWEEQQEAV